MGGEKITQLIPERDRITIEASVRDKAYQIIKKKGATHYGIGTCVVQIINSILNDERRVLPVSNYDDNAHLYNGFPAVVGRAGIIRRLDTSMTEQEGIMFQKSNNAIKKIIEEATK
jgi:L-lactate dehydrogenase